MSPNPRNVAPSPSGTPNAVKVEPPPLYYLAIDGGHELDSAQFGAELQKRFGWKNLVDDFMAHPEDPRALHDPAHPFLVLKKINNPFGGKPVVVVAPNGELGYGLDAQWAKYTNEQPLIADSPYVTKQQGEFKHEDGTVTYGRYTAARHSFKLVTSLLLRPSTHSLSLSTHKTVPSLLEYGEAAAKAQRQAVFVQVSSHGYLGGMMAGEVLRTSTVAIPESVREPYWEYWLALGKICHLTFRGPLWIILAQCSTTNSACWTMWARMMAASDPPVRGILAYEESAPGAVGARDIISRFMHHLEAGESFIDGWKKANGYGESWASPWAAIVHVDALSDKMKDFHRFQPLKADPPGPPGDRASYIGYMTSIPDGEFIFEAEEPFAFSLWYVPPPVPNQEKPPPGVRIEPATLSEDAAYLAEDKNWQIAVLRKVKPEGSQSFRYDRIKKVTLEMIFIRPTYPHQLNYQPLFEVRAAWFYEAQQVPCTTKIRGNVLELQSEHPAEVISVDLKCVTRPSKCPPVQGGHTYLWWRVTLETQSGTYTHDFRTEGLSY